VNVRLGIANSFCPGQLSQISWYKNSQSGQEDIKYAIAVAPGNFEHQLNPEVLERSKPFFSCS